MIDIEQFHDQHRDLLNVAQELAAGLDAEALASNGWDTRGLLSTLAGKLKVHLVLEDNLLYPDMLSSPDENVRIVTQQFIDEMSGIAEAFQAYVDRWPHAMAVEERPQEFIDETKAILAVFGERVDKEEKILYPMARKAGERLKTIMPSASNLAHTA